MKKRTPIILNSFYGKILGSKNYKLELGNFICDAENNNFYNNIEKILDEPKVKELLSIFGSKIEDMEVNGIFYELSYNRILAILKILIIKNNEKINKFVGIREEFERNIILGKFNEAKNNLENCLKSFGESIWYIRSKIILLAYSNKSDELQKFCEDCRSRCDGKSIINSIIASFQMIYDTEDAYLHLSLMILSNIKEMQKINEKTTSNFLGLLCCVDPLIGRYDYESALKSIQAYNLIDQYVLVSEIFFRIDFRNDISDFSNYLEQNFFKKIMHVIDDPKLNNVFMCGNKSELWEGFLLYEKGSYREVVDKFLKDMNEMKNIFSYVNIVAKSCVYADVAFPENLGVISELIHILKNVYQMKGSQKQLKDKLISICIKFSGFTQNSQLQMIIFKTFYSNCDIDDIKYCAQKNINCYSENTKLTYEISKFSEHSIIRHKNSNVESMSNHRKIKSDIVNLLDNADILDDLFKNLSETEILKRDYIEFYSEYLIYFNRIEDVLNYTVQCLIENQESYSCIPMKMIMNRVEDDVISTLQAVIFTKFFTKFVTPEKNYVLNECFEDFLNTNDVNKPSELLKKIDQLDPLQTIFFKDICLTETMDFLGCFENLNDLRNERLLILDLLFDKNAISNKYRLDEVEKVINQMIIDNGTNHFNGAKISVDEEAILSKNSDTLLSLMNAYFDCNDEGVEDKAIVTNSSDNEGLEIGYVMGSKNLIVFKMINILRDSFVFDEEYGFDKNLSTEIRHGFFGNCMRAVLQENRLLSEINENGSYKKDDYWKHTCSMLLESIWNEIDNCIINFTKKANALISEAEEWMRISNGNWSQNNNIFYPIFIIYKDDVDLMKEKIEHIDDHMEFGREILKVIWSKTEKSLEKIRQKLAEEFQARFDLLFQELISSIVKVKKVVVLEELFDAINIARDKVKEEISTVITWFQRGELQYTSNIEVDKVIGVSTNLYSQIRKNNSKVIENIHADLIGVEIDGNKVKPFLLALINILDNCYHHSGLGLETNVEINAIRKENNINITIKNNVDTSKADSISIDTINGINTKLKQTGSMKFMRSEGGTGILKANYHLSSIGSNGALKIGFTENIFEVELNYAI